MCGRATEPFAFIGDMAIGPKCAKRAGIIPSKARKGSKVRFTVATKRAKAPQTMDLFEGIENDT